MPDRPRVTTTLMLPNIAMSQLQRVLDKNPSIKQALCASLGIPNTADPTELCLTSERVSDRRHFWEVTDDVMQGMEEWWQAVMTKKGEDPNMSEQMYEELFAKFAGPATTVEVYCPSEVKGAHRVVRTEGEGVAETAARFMDLVLHQQQITILSSGEDLVYLTGPPGTGKTVVLMLKGLIWLRDGHEVQVVSMYDESVAATLFMAKSLNSKTGHQSGKVHVHCMKDRSVEDTVVSVLAARVDMHGELFVIVDEVNGAAFETFCNKLKSQVQKLHLWAGRIYHSFIPADFTEFQMNVPLRSPEVVTREVQSSDFFLKYGLVREYVVNAYPPSDGPFVRELRHEGPNHPDDIKPSECEECGRQVAAVLKELHVGDVVSTSPTDSPNPLGYRDVFVLSSAEQPVGFITGFRQSGIPFRHLEKKDTRGNTQTLQEVATMTGPDAVVISEPRFVSGLERKVVVWLQSEAGAQAAEHFGRLHGFSRSSSQLVLVTRPQPPLAVEETIGEPGQDTTGNGADGRAQPGGRDDVDVMEAVLDELAQQLRTDGFHLDNCDASAALTMTVTYRDGQDRVLYISLDRGRVTLVETEPVNLDGRVTLTSAQTLTLVRNPLQGVQEAIAQDRLKLFNTPRLLTFEPLLTRMRSMFDARLPQLRR